MVKEIFFTVMMRIMFFHTLIMMMLQGCAFVQFTQRKSAEKAAEGTFNKLLIRGNKITIRYRNLS